jgi:hypothetical protein
MSSLTSSSEMLPRDDLRLDILAWWFVAGGGLDRSLVARGRL